MSTAQYYVQLEDTAYQWQINAYERGSDESIGTPIGHGYIVITQEKLNLLVAKNSEFAARHGYQYDREAAVDSHNTVAVPALGDMWKLWLWGHGYLVHTDQLITIDKITDIAGPIAASTWRSYVARGTAPEPDDRIIDTRGRARPVWWRSRIAAWMMTRPGQGARTDLAS